MDDAGPRFDVALFDAARREGLPPLETAGEEEIAGCAARMAGRCGEPLVDAIRIAAALVVGGDHAEALVARHLDHLLWVESRRARWRHGRVDRDTPVRVEGEEHLQATSNRPTVVVTPMTLTMDDALLVTDVLLGWRSAVVYGEGLGRESVALGTYAPERLRLAPATISGMRDVLTTLDSNGCFLTYPDFVYHGHRLQTFPFFGTRLPISTSYLAICRVPRCVLLPCVLHRGQGELVARFAAPVEIVGVEGADRRWATTLTGVTVARLLETAILHDPAQWLLLMTLVARSSQRGSA